MEGVVPKDLWLKRTDNHIGSFNFNNKELIVCVIQDKGRSCCGCLLGLFLGAGLETLLGICCE